MTRSTRALKASASSLILAAALGWAAPALAQDGQFPPPTAPLAADGRRPDGIGAPDLHEPRLGAPPPAFFCSEVEKLEFLLKYVYPPTQQASKNNIAAHDYLVKVRRLRDASTGALRDAYGAEHDDWQPKWRKHEETLQTFLEILDAVRAIPVVDCRGLGIAALPPAAPPEPPREGPKLAAALEAARAGAPEFDVGVGGYADLGLRPSRPFDGSEAESPLRHRLRLSAEYRYDRNDRPQTAPAQPWTGGLSYPPLDAGMTFPPGAVGASDPVDPSDTGFHPVEAPASEGFFPQPGSATSPAEPDATWEATIPWPPSTGMTSLDPPPPPPVQGHRVVDPPAASSTPAYPDCPTHRVPGTPEHVRQFHS